MNGSRRGNASVRISLVAILVGAILAGGASIASRLANEPTTFADTAALQQPDMLAATTAVPPPTTTAQPTTATTTKAALTSTISVSTTTSQPTTAPPTTTTTTKPVVLSQTQQVFALVNQARAQAGCNPLADDPRLDTAAQQHSDDMSARDYFSHTTPEGVTFDRREETAGYPNPAGENIAQGQTSAQSVMSAWLNSPGHRANILNCSYVAIGVGLNTNRWYWTQDFGR